MYEILHLDGINAVNAVTLVCLLQACGNVANLERGKEIYAQIFQEGLYTSNVLIANALITYMCIQSACHSEDAAVGPDNLPQSDVVTCIWTTMMAAYAQCG